MYLLFSALLRMWARFSSSSAATGVERGTYRRGHYLPHAHARQPLSETTRNRIIHDAVTLKPWAIRRRITATPSAESAGGKWAPRRGAIGASMAGFRVCFRPRNGRSRYAHHFVERHVYAWASLFARVCFFAPRARGPFVVLALISSFAGSRFSRRSNGRGAVARAGFCRFRGEVVVEQVAR